jgi:hypothetical protein
MRQQFAELVGRWLGSVRGEGVFGEGPVRAISNQIEFYRRAAQFRIDAARSGQNTVNWLILSIVAFCPVNLVTHILMLRAIPGAGPVEDVFSLSRDQLTKIPIPAAPGTPEGAGELAPTGRAPSAFSSEAGPHETLHSQVFRVLAFPKCNTDNLTCAVHFAQVPRGQERESLEQCVQSWLLLGHFGAFGGNGFDEYRGVTFDEKTDSASFWCDMGVTDAEMALRVLINMLEHWHTHGTTIEAVVLGDSNANSQE